MPSPGGSDTFLGHELAGYRIEALIGRGGMGSVYRAEEQELQRKVALKLIAPELARDSRFRERFLTESQLAASLDHPHVVPIYRAGAAEDRLYLAMRYVEGTDLAKVIAEQGALEPARAVGLVSQVAEALDAAHAKGLVHRDVKPSNVLIAQSGGKEHAYLADFGLTKRTGSLSGVTASGDVVGTLEYVAPEQITGGELDERADVYSLGCVLYECLTGQPPFPRATDVALLWAHVHEEPEAPSKLRQELPNELDAVVSTGLAKEPGRRYRSAGELADAARSAIGLGEAVPLRRRPRWLLPAALIAAAALAVVLVLTLRGGEGSLTAISPNHVGVIDPNTNELVAEVPVGIRPGPVAAGEGSAWVANLDDQTVSRIDPELREVTRTIPVGGFTSDITAGEGSVWAFLSEEMELARISPEFGEVERRAMGGTEDLPSCGATSTIAVDDGRAWITCLNVITARVDLDTGRSDVTPRETLASPAPFYEEDFNDIGVGLGSTWAVNRAINAVTRIDPDTNTGEGTQSITVGKSPYAITVGAGSLWVANREDDTVSRIEIAPGRPPTVTAIPVGDGPVDVAYGEDAVWVANSLGGTVSRIGPQTNEVVATIEVGKRPQRIAAGEGAVWVTLEAPIPTR